MGIDIKLGNGNGIFVDVNDNRAIKMAHSIPEILPTKTKNQYRFLSELLANEVGGGTDMNIDGSITPENFAILSQTGYDIYITKVIIVLGGGIIGHNKFGSINDLTVGIDLFLEESNDKTYLFQGAKTSGQLIAFSGFSNPYGDGTSSWELTKWDGNNQVHTITIPISEYIPGGLRIGRGTKDRLCVTVNDNLITLPVFFSRVFGYKHYPFEKPQGKRERRTQRPSGQMERGC